MRLAILSALAICPLFLVFAACGGGEKPADHPEPAGSSSGGTATTTAGDGGPTSTTTVLVGDAGELRGTKLTETGTMTVEAGGPPLDPNKRDPGRSTEDVMTIVRSHRDEARACYDDFLKTHPRVEGNINISWKLDPKGKVTETGIDDSKSDMHDPALVKCLGDVIRKITWAPSPRGVETTFHYPFNFHPKGPQGAQP
jgi:hypothetical protein